MWCSFATALAVKVDACVLSDRLNHRDSFKRFVKVQIHAVEGDFARAANFVCNVSEHTFGDVHHTVNVGVCLVKFQQSELGIMALIHTFVSENSADFVNFFKPADDKAFKIKFQSNTKVHIDIERVVVRNERPCVRAARDDAPPAFETSIGVSTSIKPCESRYLRIVLIILERLIKVSFTSGFIIRST